MFPKSLCYKRVYAFGLFEDSTTIDNHIGASTSGAIQINGHEQKTDDLEVSSAMLFFCADQFSCYVCPPRCVLPPMNPKTPLDKMGRFE